MLRCVCERDRAGGLLLITCALRGDAGAHSRANRHRKGVRALQRGAEVISHPGLPAHAPYALVLNKNTHALSQEPPLIRIWEMILLLCRSFLCYLDNVRWWGGWVKTKSCERNLPIGMKNQSFLDSNEMKSKWSKSFRRNLDNVSNCTHICHRRRFKDKTKQNKTKQNKSLFSCCLDEEQMEWEFQKRT